MLSWFSPLCRSVLWIDALLFRQITGMSPRSIGRTCSYLQPDGHFISSVSSERWSESNSFHEGRSQPLWPPPSFFWIIQHINTQCSPCSIGARWLGARYIQVGKQRERIRGLSLGRCRPGTNDNSRSWTTGKLSTLFPLYSPSLFPQPFTSLAHPLPRVARVISGRVWIHANGLWLWALNPINAV